MTPENADSDALFAGGGELGAMMRAYDWCTTPLGPPATWPLSLRTALRILLTSRQPFWLGWGPELTYFYNDPYKSIIGGKHPWALGKPFAEVWREIWDVVGPMAANVVQGNEGTYVEAQRLIMERNGYPEETYYTYSYSPVPDDEGNVAGLICANTDDTQRVIGERQLATLRELGASAGKAPDVASACRMVLTALATNARDVPFATIRIAGDDGQLATFDSHAGLAGLALPTPDGSEGVVVVDAPSGVALPTGAWPVPPTRIAIVALGNPGGARAGTLALGLNPYRLFDGSYAAFVELVAREASGSIAHADAFAQERRRAEALAALDRAKTAFFSNVSHEFRTPLTLMLGPLEELLAEAPAGEREALALVHRNARRLLKLVNALLDFSRVEAGRATPHFRVVDLARLTSGLAEAFRPLMARGNLRFDVDCAPLSRPVAVDREQWEKIVFNLLSNAFKFTIAGGVSVRLREDGDGALLEVADTGSGIAPSELEKLFERFHRVRDAGGRSFEGTGIGLALVRELVTAHGGEIAVASELGRGTTFSVRLPFAASDAPASDDGDIATDATPWLAELESAEPAPPVAITGGTRPNVLLVDDNADMRAYLRKLLANEYELDEAADGEAALGRITARRPDLVLTDMMMPRLDGAGLIAAIRADPTLHLVPVIVLSARAGEEAQVEGLQTGADDYLVKPFSARELKARVAAQIALSKLRRELVDHEAQLRRDAEQAWRRVRESEERFRQFTDIAPAILFATNPAGECTFVSAGWQEFTGQRVSDALRFGWLDAVVPADRAAARDAFTAANAKQVPFEFDYRVRGRDGSERWVLANGRPRFDANGGFEGYIGSVIDVHARREAENALRESDSRKTEFLATLAHELRNPLAPLSNGLEVLSRAKGAAHAVQQLLPPMERQLRHLVRLVDDLLEVARITRGSIELRRSVVALLPIVRAAVETSRPLLDTHRHTLELAIDAADVRVDGDPVRLTQILSNLLNNAAKYTPEGGVVRVRAKRDDARVGIEVSDTGVGFEPHEAPQLFEMFARGERSGLLHAKGLGVGLALAQRLAQMQGGVIEAASEGPGAGARFTLWLPIVDAARAVEQPAPGADEAPLAGLRALVVDDNHDAGDTLAILLGSLGARADVTRSGGEALMAFAREHPDVVLLDLGMPWMDGYAVARELRDRWPDHRVPLVAVTGWGQEADRARTREAGFDHHVVKPVDIELLLDVLRKIRRTGPANP